MEVLIDICLKTHLSLCPYARTDTVHWPRHEIPLGLAACTPVFLFLFGYQNISPSFTTVSFFPPNATHVWFMTAGETVAVSQVLALSQV